MKFEDHPPPALPSRCAHPCHECGLRRNSAFLPLPADELRAIEQFRDGDQVGEAGHSLLLERRASSQLFTLYAGWAFRFKTLSDGRRQILSFLLPGDFIGLQNEFAEGQTHGVEALTAVSLCVFSRDRLRGLFHTHPRLGYDIAWLTAREEKMVDDNLVTAGRRNAGERIAMLLMHLFRRAERVGLAREGWVEFPLNQQHIADALGLSLVHTNKTLRKLEQSGLHQIDRGWLRILDPLALETLGDYFERPMHAAPLI